MSTSRATFRALAPELADVSDGDVDTFLGYAAAQLDAIEWGTLYVQGAARLAAHMLTLRSRSEQGQAGAGPVQQLSTGDASVTFGATLGVLSRDSPLGTTQHGLEFLRLRRMIVPSVPPVV